MDNIQLTRKWSAPVQRACVRAITIDNRIIIRSENEGKNIETIIESNFEFQDKYGCKYFLDPSRLDTLGPILQIINTNTSSVFVTSENSFYLYFENGSHLLIKMDEKFEAWQFAIMGELLVVCAPGGDLIITSQKEVRPAR
jgi:Family of unknown function (DUF6188)